MKKGCVLLPLLLIIALTMTMFFTCPKPIDHQIALRQLSNEVINHKIEDVAPSNEVGDLLRMAGHVFGDTPARIAVENLVVVNDYYFFSVGRLRFQNHEQTVSFGIFNHVFVPSKEDVLQQLQEYGL